MRRVHTFVLRARITAKTDSVMVKSGCVRVQLSVLILVSIKNRDALLIRIHVSFSTRERQKDSVMLKRISFLISDL